MPELPEVEVTCRALRPYLVGESIVSIDLRVQRLRQPLPERFSCWRPERIASLKRIGKYLLMGLEEHDLLIHLGMTGSLRLVPAKTDFLSADRICWSLGNGDQLRLHDPRKFSLVTLFPQGEGGSSPLLMSIGPDLTRSDPPLLELAERGSKSGRTVKAILMDAGFVAGVGNIYANEALFLAGIHPLRRGNGLTPEEWLRLLQSVQEVLALAIATGEEYAADYRSEAITGGYFPMAWSVYGRAGGECSRCGTLIERFAQHGRSSFVCPDCQS